MEQAKILIIDQNVLVRRAVASFLEKSDSFIPLWDSGGIKHLRYYIEKTEPDVVLLAIESEKSEESSLLNMINVSFPSLPIVAISPKTKEGAEAAVLALKNGAVDVITIPEHRNIILFAKQHLGKRLYSILRVANNLHHRQSLSDEILDSLIYPQKSFEHFTREHYTVPTPKIIVIGGCTGGPRALFSLISKLPAQLPVPVVVVQHFPKIYTRALAEKLDEESEVNVREAFDGAGAEAGTVWIAPGGYHCELNRSGQKTVLNIHYGPREHNARPGIDMLFRSAAYNWSDKVLGVLLSGSGIDGIAGAEEIRRAGGEVIVQDPETAIAPELPLSVIRHGLTRAYYSPEKLAERLIAVTTRPKKPYNEVTGKEFIG
ncbi:MAG TPA: chemotaxis protein CheB [Balneolaceae bacterium]